MYLSVYITFVLYLKIHMVKDNESLPQHSVEMRGLPHLIAGEFTFTVVFANDTQVLCKKKKKS